jgi:hypothetical protein
VRGRIPVEVQRLLRYTISQEETLGCGQGDTPLECRLPVEDAAARRVAASLVDPGLAQSLNLWMQSLVNELGLTDTYDEVVRDVLVTIEENR